MKRNLLYIILTLIIVVTIVKTCEQEPKIITKTEYITKTDTIKSVKIIEKPILKHVERVKTVKGDDSIIYIEKPSKTSIKAFEYDATIKTDSSRADLKILTTGELLDVKGTITYNQKETTTKIIKNKSGLFIGAQSDLNFNEVGLTLDYQFKNSVMIGTSLNYDRITEQPNIKLKLAIKL